MRENLRVDNISDPDAVSQGEMMEIISCCHAASREVWGVLASPCTLFLKGAKETSQSAGLKYELKTELGSSCQRENLCVVG